MYWCCPSNYNKLIPKKNKFIDSCENDDTCKYEYKNACYLECESSIHLKNDKIKHVNKILKVFI